MVYQYRKHKDAKGAYQPFQIANGVWILANGVSICACSKYLVPKIYRTAKKNENDVWFRVFPQIVLGVL